MSGSVRGDICGPDGMTAAWPRTDEKAVTQWQLEELGAAAWIGLGTFLPQAFELRLERAAAALEAFLKSRGPSSLAKLEVSVDQVRQHGLASKALPSSQDYKGRVEKLEMALRLARCFRSKKEASRFLSSKANSLADLALDYYGRSSFIDDGDYGFDYPRERRHLAEARRKPADPRWPTPR